MDYPKSVPGVGLVGGKFVDENAGTGEQGSLIPSAWGNAATEEILNVIRDAGDEPAEADLFQLQKAIRKMMSGALDDAVPAGTVVMSAGSITRPGWIKCNGATLSRAAYAELFAAIGTIYGAGDGVSTFKIPDVRGFFQRFWSDGGANDSGRALGSIQAATAGTFDVYAKAYDAGPGAATVTDAISFNGGAFINEEASGGATVVVRPGDLKPINIAFMGLIRF